MDVRVLLLGYSLVVCQLVGGICLDPPCDPATKAPTVLSTSTTIGDETTFIPREQLSSTHKDLPPTETDGPASHATVTGSSLGGNTEGIENESTPAVQTVGGTTGETTQSTHKTSINVIDALTSEVYTGDVPISTSPSGPASVEVLSSTLAIVDKTTVSPNQAGLGFPVTGFYYIIGVLSASVLFLIGCVITLLVVRKRRWLVQRASSLSYSVESGPHELNNMRRLSSEPDSNARAEAALDFDEYVEFDRVSFSSGVGYPVMKED